MNVTAIFIAVAGIFGAIGGLAGVGALAKVFVVDRHVVKRDDIAAERQYSERLRKDLEAEIVARRADRVASDKEILSLRTEIGNLRNNWDACRTECQRLRRLVEGGAG